MKIDLLFPTLPPALDGIGDHTACLAAELSTRHRVRVLTSQACATPVEGVDVQTVGIPGVPVQGTDTLSLTQAIRARPPDWLIVQYNPFSYGRWGFNVGLPLALLHLRSAAPEVRVALVVHEPFVPAEGWRNAVMTTWQRAQLGALGRAADLVLFSIERWALDLAKWFPNARVSHVPVGSNVPRVPASDVTETRRRLGVQEGELVVGLFGSAHPSHLFGFSRAALEALSGSAQVLYVGPHESRVRAALGDVRLVATGALPPPAVSEAFSAMDLYLAPFRKGVSTRRGSFMTGLQHGVPTVSTRGEHTGSWFAPLDGRAFVLCPDTDPGRFAREVAEIARGPDRRARIGRAGQDAFDRTFAWPRIASAVEAEMALCDPSRDARPVGEPYASPHLEPRAPVL